MRASILLLLVVAIIISLALELPLIAALLFFALVAIIAFFLVSKTYTATKKTAKSLSTGIMDDLEKAKGQSPKAVSEFGKMFTALGEKTAEATWPKDKEEWRSPDLFARLGTASKNLLEGITRLFK